MSDPSSAALLIIMVIGFGGAALVAVLWYLLVVTEGVYLGRRVVVALYDLYARRYDRIKNYDRPWEVTTLANPLLVALEDSGVRSPFILDVAAGTARLSLALLNADPTLRNRAGGFPGVMIGLDFSRRMLAIGAKNLAELPAKTAANGRVALIWQHAQALPFSDGLFDAVTCLEALEFMPDPDAVIAELIRVTRPGGLLLITNRKGVRFMPGKIRTSRALADHLEGQGLEKVTIEVWQVDYELVWANKPGSSSPALPTSNVRIEAVIPQTLHCPCCGACALEYAAETLRCGSCQTVIPIGADGVIDYAQVECAQNTA